MYMKERFSVVGTICGLGVLVSVACSAQTKGHAGAGGHESARPATVIGDCFALGDWSAREICLSGVDEKSIGSCEASNPEACRPFQQMHVASKRVRVLEAEIKKNAAITYGSYLDDDPGYVEDLQKFLDDSGASWSAYRGAQCQLEPLVNGMSRRELDVMVEQCRLERTRMRVQELEALLRVLESNKER